MGQRGKKRNHVLTEHQRKVMTLVANGNSSKDIASFLYIRPSSVNELLIKIYASLGVKSRAQAVAVCLITGEVAPEAIRVPDGKLLEKLKNDHPFPDEPEDEPEPENSEIEHRWAYRLVAVLYDLDRCEHGRHQLDHCFGCNGPSQGNPHIKPGQTIGYGYSGHPIVMPRPERKAEPAAWRH